LRWNNAKTVGVTAGGFGVSQICGNKEIVIDSILFFSYYRAELFVGEGSYELSRIKTKITRFLVATGLHDM
jgi:hypothetical protein